MNASTSFKIDSDVPAPKQRAGRPVKYPFSQLEVGQSFFAPHVSAAGVSAASRMFAKRNGGHFSTRTWIENGVEGARVWRIA